MKKKKMMTIFTAFCMVLILRPVTTFTYSEPTPEPEPALEQGIEKGVTEHIPLYIVPDNGEVVNDITDDSSKEFFTVTTANGNTYLLVIDHSQNAENVYMLSMIDESDLQDFIK